MSKESERDLEKVQIPDIEYLLTLINEWVQVSLSVFSLGLGSDSSFSFRFSCATKVRGVRWNLSVH